jgi:hypothetical protein
MPKESDFNKLFDSNPKVKYAMAKEYRKIAQENPLELYPLLDKFVSLLDSENNVIKWTSIDIIGLLAKIDSDNKINLLLSKLYKQLNCGKMITVNHIIECLMFVSMAKPKYKNKIIKELLKIKNYVYDTDECKNIIYGKMIEAFDKIVVDINRNKDVKAFIEEQSHNTRNSVKKKAEKLLKETKKK